MNNLSTIELAALTAIAACILTIAVFALAIISAAIGSREDNDA